MCLLALLEDVRANLQGNGDRTSERRFTADLEMLTSLIQTHKRNKACVVSSAISAIDWNQSQLEIVSTTSAVSPLKG